MPLVAWANPAPILPLASFTYIEDAALLRDIGLGESPVWCYNLEANSILIAAPKKERSLCELTLRTELERQAARYDLEISGLQLRIETMGAEHESILKVKDQELLRLEEVAVSKPNDYWYLFLAAGVIIGSVSTLAIVKAVD
mgnify:CR=1 FL=1